MNRFERYEYLWVTLLLCGSTVVFTYPQAVQLDRAVGPHYDALFSIWRIGWIAHALRQHLPLFDANIFFPEALTLAYSDAIPAIGLIAAPFVIAGVKLAVVYNLLVLVTFPATGIGMYLLAKEVTDNAIAALFAAIVFAFSPYRLAHLPQIELLWTWPIPFACSALFRVIKRPTFRGGMYLFLAVVAQVLGCLYYGAFLVFGLLILTIVWLTGRSARTLRNVATIVLLAATATLMVLWPYLRIYQLAATLHSARTLVDIAPWSADLAAYASVSATSLAYRHLANIGTIEMTLFPGAVAIGAALWSFRKVDRVTVGYGLLACLAFDLSLGIHGTGFFILLFKSLPVFSGLRVPARAYILFSACLSVLAACGAADVMHRVARRRSPSAARRLGLTLILVTMMEFWSAPIRLMALDTRPAESYEWLARQPSAVILEWPVAKASSLGVTHDPFYMYYSTHHWKPLVNGYSGNYPDSYIELLEILTNFPSTLSVAALRQHHVTHVILHREFDPESFDRMADRLSHLVEFEPLIYEKRREGDVAVFKLRP